MESSIPIMAAVVAAPIRNPCSDAVEYLAELSNEPGLQHNSAGCVQKEVTWLTPPQCDVVKDGSNWADDRSLELCRCQLQTGHTCKVDLNHLGAVDCHIHPGEANE